MAKCRAERCFVLIQFRTHFDLCICRGQEPPSFSLKKFRLFRNMGSYARGHRKRLLLLWFLIQCSETSVVFSYWYLHKIITYKNFEKYLTCKKSYSHFSILNIHVCDHVGRVFKISVFVQLSFVFNPTYCKCNSSSCNSSHNSYFLYVLNFRFK